MAVQVHTSPACGGAEKRTAAEKRDYIRYHRPYGISIAEGCRLMGLPRSTYYDAPAVKADDAGIVVAMTAICDEFETYGYRRVGAEIRHRGIRATGVGVVGKFAGPHAEL
jgi:putative transposase